MKSSKLRVALVGCGQIADAHLQEIRKISCAELVAVCDRHPDLAEQAAARFAIPATFDNLERMLATARPDVLHISTPPQTHAPIARTALAAGVHVYVEKPFAVDVAEADEVLDLARARGCLVCVGHDHIFDPTWLECRQRVARGELGQIVHVDALLGYDLSGPFGKQFVDEPDHWLHQLPGGLFQNNIPHALYKITEFLRDERPTVWATWFGARVAGGTPTELRVLLRGAEVTANLVFTSSIRPVPRVVRVYGTRQSLEVDFEGRLLRRYRGATMPGAFARIEMPFRHLTEAAGSLARSLWRFLRCDLHYFAGMNRLIGQFYQAIRDKGQPPIPYSEIRRVTAIMDEIFQQCRAGASTWNGARANGAASARRSSYRRADGAPLAAVSQE